jgi:hypothetical protein
MSASFCINCDKMVGGYEKYCLDCVDKYGVKQDVSYWKTRGFEAWQNREAEFRKDLAAVPADYKKPKTPTRHIRHVELLRYNALSKPVYIPNMSRGKNSNPAYRKRFGSRAK